MAPPEASAELPVCRLAPDTERRRALRPRITHPVELTITVSGPIAETLGVLAEEQGSSVEDALVRLLRERFPTAMTAEEQQEKRERAMEWLNREPTPEDIAESEAMQAEYERRTDPSTPWGFVYPHLRPEPITTEYLRGLESSLRERPYKDRCAETAAELLVEVKRLRGLPDPGW